MLAVFLPGERITSTFWFYHGVKGYEGAVDVTTFVPSIPLNGQGKEVVMKLYSQELLNNDTFWTDSSGLHMQKRRLNFMPQYNLTVHEPMAGNYYPVNSLLTIVDQTNASRRMSVLTDRSQGGISPRNGTIEIMIQRRLVMDDNRGVEEPLDEKQANNDGL